MATDMVKVLKDRGSSASLRATSEWIKQVLSSLGRLPAPFKATVQRIQTTWDIFDQRVRSESQDDLVANGRDVMNKLGDIVCSVLLATDAAVDNDVSSMEVYLRFLEDRLGLQSLGRDWKAVARSDGLLAFPTRDSEPASNVCMVFKL